MWRPKNWASIKYHNISREIYDTHEVELGYQFFEAGADAMLEALKKQGIPNDVYQSYLKGAILQGLDIKQPYTYFGKKGTLVFIPDEED